MNQHYWEEKWRDSPQLPVNNYAITCQTIIKDLWQKHIFDIGCGSGSDALYFASKGHYVTAMDLSKYSIEQLNISAKTQKLSIEVITGDITSTNLPDDCFDVVYAHLSLHYFWDQDTTNIFKKIYRSLKTDGIFFVKCKSIDDELYWKGEFIETDMYRTDHARHFFSTDYTHEKLMSAGFSEIEIVKSHSTYRKYESCFIEAIAKKDE